MKKIYKILLLVSLIILLVLYFINSSFIINSLLDYTKLFYTKLFPSSFIFFVFSTLLIDYKILDLIPINITSFYVFILSLISGFSSGAKYTKDLLERNVISKSEAKSILKFTHNPNPLFIIGSINTIINDKNICIKLLLSIILSNLIIFIFSKKNKSITKNYSPYPKSFSSSLTNAIYSSLKTILLIYGTSIFFFLIANIINKYIYINTHLYVLIFGLFDLTKGIFSTSIINSITERLFFILLFLSFGSLSIHMQVKSILNNNELYISFFKGRIIGFILTLIIFLLLY